MACTLSRMLPGEMPLRRALWLARSRHRPPAPAVPADPVRHAPLFTFAGALDAPPRLALSGAARVEVRGDTLVVGVPLIWCLPERHLRVVVAHELALPKTRWSGLVRRLLLLRGYRPEDRLRAATQRLVDAVERTRDAAAIGAAGGGLTAVDDAANAIFRAEAVRDGFELFTATEGMRTGDPDPVRIEDLHAGWHRYLTRTGAPGTTWPASTTEIEIPAAHPGLAAELRTAAAGPHSSNNGLAKRAVPLDLAATAAEERVLAAGAYAAVGDSAVTVAWRRFGDLPVAEYATATREHAASLIAAVEALLGRPAEPDELADTLLRRPVDVQRAEYEAMFGTPDETERADPPWLGAALLAVVSEDALLAHGWRREHPAVSYGLVGPDGSTVDLYDLYGKPDELRALLIEATAGPAAPD